MDNQTSLAILSNIQPTDLGTGIFLLPDVESPIFGAAIKRCIADIIYPECVKRGQFAMAFKWVPNSAMTFQQIQINACGQLLCVDSCAPEGCVCNRAQGICQ